MRILAISVDTRDVSKKLAKEYNLDFPLIEDKDLALARQYVGVDQSGFSLPGVVVIAPDGTVALRQVGVTPGDRIYAADLLKVVDDIAARHGVAVTGGPGVGGGYEPLQRANIRIGATLGLVQERAVDNDLGFSVDLALAGLYPLGRYVMVGALARGITGSATNADIDIAVRLRWPVVDDNGELYAQIPFGVSFDLTDEPGDDHEGMGWNSGLALGLQFAPKPSMAIFLEFDSLGHRFAGRNGLDARLELRFQVGGGISFLF